MSTNVRRDPGPDHPITVTPTGHLVTVTAQGRPVASSEHTLTLHEAGYGPVYYFPPTEVNWDVLRESHTTSYCPYKGDAGYVDVVLADGHAGDPTVMATSAGSTPSPTNRWPSSRATLRSTPSG